MRDNQRYYLYVSEGQSPKLFRGQEAIFEINKHLKTSDNIGFSLETEDNVIYISLVEQKVYIDNTCFEFSSIKYPSVRWINYKRSQVEIDPHGQSKKEKEVERGLGLQATHNGQNKKIIVHVRGKDLFIERDGVEELV